MTEIHLSTNELLRRLESKDHTNAGAEVNALASEFRRGLPISRLCPALRSKDTEVVESALWIASEIGSKAVQLVDVILPLATSTASIGAKRKISDICLFSIPHDNRLIPTISRYLIDESCFVRFL